VLLEIDDDQPVRIRGRAQALREAQARLSSYVQPGRLISDELIADRKAEARRESEA